MWWLRPDLEVAQANTHTSLVGSSLKIAAWLPLPWTRRRPLATRGIAHSTRTSHIRNSVRPTFHILRIFRSRRLSPSERGERFNFPGQTCPDPLVTLTRTAWLVKHSRFAGSISATIKRQTPIIPTTKSPELSLIFNARYI